MENNNLENKMLEDLKSGLNVITKTFDKSMSTIDEKLKKELGAKGYARYKAYQKKRFKLTQEGKEFEAKELDKIFLSGE